MLDNRTETLLLEKLRELGMRISRRVFDSVQGAGSIELMSQIVEKGEDDTIYAIDKVSEEVIIEYFEKEVAPAVSCVLIAEGIGGGSVVFAPSGREDDAEVRIIVDPIDGTRGLMHAKRSAWILSGAAPNYGDNTTLEYISVAVQTEIPHPKQRIGDQLWATEKGGAFGERFDIKTDERAALAFTPSKAKNLDHGFVSFNRFFPGVKDIISEIEEELARKLSGYDWPIHYFEDQYLSSGGQLYGLIMGHDRLVVEIRGLLAGKMRDRGDLSPLCCHPYDVCTELIARKAGVIVTPPGGKRLTNKLETTGDVSWIGYANEAIYGTVGPRLTSILQKRKLI